MHILYQDMYWVHSVYWGGGGYFSIYLYRGPEHDKKWTQLDLRFWQIEMSKRSENIKKGVNQIVNH